jgi:hypothetical protein
VAAVQYPFTQNKYTKYREWNLHNKKKESWEVRAVPSLCELYLGICLTTAEKHGKPSVRVVEKCPDIPMAATLNDDQITF